MTENEMTPQDWEQAENYLNSLIAAYAAIGWAGQFGLQMFLLPLKKRLDAGERSANLYADIMKCE